MQFAVFITTFSILSLCVGEVRSQNQFRSYHEGFDLIRKRESSPQATELSGNLTTLAGGLLSTIWKQNLTGPGDVLSRMTAYNVSMTCMRDIETVFTSLGSQELYAMTMVDADGKPGSDLFRGNTHWLGSYSECRQIKPVLYVNKTWTEPFQTQYCTANIYLPGKPPTQPPTQITLAVCVPDSCSDKDVLVLTNMVTSLLSLPAVSSQCQIAPDKRPLDSSAIGVICMLSIIAVLVVSGSLYDLYRRHRTCSQSLLLPEVSGNPYTPIHSNEQDGSEPEVSDNTQVVQTKNIRVLTDTNNSTPSVVGRILLCFSVFTNGDKVLTVGTPSDSNLGAIHGIRFLSMSWVILGHTYFFAMGAFTNLTELYKMATTFTFQAILNATVSVDSFFVLSGTLVAYLLLREIRDKNGPLGVSWWKFYLHRYWRLTPPYMILLGTNVSLFWYLGEGPLWPKDWDIYCRTNWWTNLLYVNNIVDAEKMCFGWSWYLANDMQFFILSPLLVVPFFFSSIVGIVINCLFLLAGMIATGVITHQHGYPADTPSFLSDPTLTQRSVHYMRDVYMAPWCRIGPYVIGVMVGYLLHKTKRSVNMHWLLVVVGWIVAAVLNTSVLYGMYHVANGHPLSPGVNAFYAATHRSVWALGLAWVIFACCTGHGGPVNRLLSWSALVPLSRLTYMAYLIHPIVMVYYYASMEAPLVLTTINMVYLFLGHMVVSYGLAFVVSMAFEAPMIGLEKIVFSRG